MQSFLIYSSSEWQHNSYLTFGYGGHYFDFNMLQTDLAVITGYND